MDSRMNIFRQFQNRLNAYNYALWLMNWDQNTETPIGSIPYKAQQIASLANEKYEIESASEYLEAIDYLFVNKSKLSNDLSREITLVYKDLRLIKHVPRKEYIDHEVLKTTSLAVLAKARDKNDFNVFLPILEQIIDFNKRAIKYMETDELKGYDILLDSYEEGMNTEIYDVFFDVLREELVPFVMHVTTNNKIKFSRRLTHGVFPINQQKKFAKYILKEMGYDFNRGVLKETPMHSFTSSVTSTDVRIGINYGENSLVSFIFSVMHEVGHAIYDQQCDPKFNQTRLYGGASLGIHESQSRLYENMIGRSLEFWEIYYEKLVEFFPKELRNIELNQFYNFINYAKRSLNRADADELTYPLHIMVRYELEKDLLNGTLKAKDLPNRFKALMAKYVGRRPVHDYDGLLQDIHWSQGAFGYFPTYAVGSAIATQLYVAMNKEIDTKALIKAKKMNEINEWLKVNLHQYSASKTPKELLLISTGEDLNPWYYITYLKEKFGKWEK